MQIVINKCFLLNLDKKIWRKSVLSFSRKTQKTQKNAKNAPLIPKNDVTEPKARIL